MFCERSRFYAYEFIWKWEKQNKLAHIWDSIVYVCCVVYAAGDAREAEQTTLTQQLNEYAT